MVKNLPKRKQIEYLNFHLWCHRITMILRCLWIFATKLKENRDKLLQYQNKYLHLQHQHNNE